MYLNLKNVSSKRSYQKDIRTYRRYKFFKSEKALEGIVLIRLEFNCLNINIQIVFKLITLESVEICQKTFQLKYYHRVTTSERNARKVVGVTYHRLGKKVEKESQSFLVLVTCIEIRFPNILFF